MHLLGLPIMTRRPDLANVLADAGGSRRRPTTPQLSVEQPAEKPTYTQPGRVGTKPITGHFPKQVRDELKKLAIERDTTLQLLMAEAFNDLFPNTENPSSCRSKSGKGSLGCRISLGKRGQPPPMSEQIVLTMSVFQLFPLLRASVNLIKFMVVVLTAVCPKFENNVSMSTTSIHVTLPKALKEHIEKRVAEGEFTSPSDYVRALVRAERDHRLKGAVALTGLGG
jgi:Antitoxin-like ribbon-helix-helix